MSRFFKSVNKGSVQLDVFYGWDIDVKEWFGDANSLRNWCTNECHQKVNLRLRVPTTTYKKEGRKGFYGTILEDKRLKYVSDRLLDDSFFSPLPSSLIDLEKTSATLAA